MSCRRWEIQVLRRHEGILDRETEDALSRHLETCVHCRTMAEKFSEIDRILFATPEPSLPSFLNEKIASRVIEEMRDDSVGSTFRHFIASLWYLRPALAGMILVLGLSLGVLTGWNLSHSINESSSGPSCDLLTLAGI